MERYLPPKHTVLLNEFDRTIADYDEHRREIYAKLVSIMQERLLYHIQAMNDIDWDAAEHDNTDDQHVNMYMEVLVKETLTLHKVLNKYLSHSELHVSGKSQGGLHICLTMLSRKSWLIFSPSLTSSYHKTSKNCLFIPNQEKAGTHLLSDCPFIYSFCSL